MSEKIKLEQAMQDFGLVDKLSPYDYKIEITNHSFDHNMYRLHIFSSITNEKAFLFRIHFSEKNIEILNTNGTSYFALSDTNVTLFHTFQEFFSFLAKSSGKKLYIFRHNVKDQQQIRFIFSNFFQKDEFYNITDHATVKYISSFHEIARRDICFIQELKPNTLPPIWNEGVAENVIKIFQQAEPTFQGFFDPTSNMIHYSFFGYEGIFQIEKNQTFFLKDSYLELHIPFSGDTISKMDVSNFLNKIEQKFRLQYLFEGTVFPFASKLEFTENTLISILHILQTKQDWKSIHLKMLNNDYHMYHFDCFHVFQFEDRFFLVEKGAFQSTLILHTTESSVIKEHIEAAILNRLEDTFPSLPEI